jgi:ABC-type nitrate/sulfonate/bicarbonate transport system substrate-binding protein
LVFDADLADRVAGDIRAPSIIFWVSAYLGYTFGAQMERQGYRVLADLAKLGIPYQGLGVMARRSLVDRSPDLAEKALRSMIESIAYINNPANKASVMRTLAKDLRLAKVEDAESGYEQMRSLYDKKIYPNIDGLKNVVRLLAGSSEQLRKLKVGSIIDDRVVKKLEKEGLF